MQSSSAPSLKLQQEHIRHQKSLEEQPKPFELPPAADLIRLLRFMESELQARDVAIAVLKAEKVKHMLYQAKYSRFGLSDPFHALQRDSDHVKHDSFDENAVRAMFDSQLGQLENLIATQRKAQLKMREQLVLAEKKYNKVCMELDEEKQKHAQDTAKGDDITVALEKDREHLKQELEFEHAQNKKLEKDLRKACQQIEEQQLTMEKHKKVAVALIKERRKMLAKVLEAERLNESVAQQLRREKEDGARQESGKLLQMEAKMERQLSEFDIEREQMRARLRREEARVADLSVQVDLLRQQLQQLSAQEQQQRRAQSPLQQAATKPDDRLGSGAAATTSAGGVVTNPPTDRSSQQLQHCVVDMGGNGAAAAAERPSLQPPPSLQADERSWLAELMPSPLLRPLNLPARVSATLPDWMLVRGGRLSGSSGLSQSQLATATASASPPTGRASSALPSSAATAGGGAAMATATSVAAVDGAAATTCAAASATTPLTSPSPIQLLQSPLASAASAPAAASPAPVSTSAPKVPSIEASGAASAPMALGGSGTPKAVVQKAAALPLPSTRKPAVPLTPPAPVSKAAPPVPPNKPQIVATKVTPASSAAAAVVAVRPVDLPAGAPVSLPTGGAATTTSALASANQTPAAAGDAESLPKPSTPDGALVTRVALTPPSPSTSAKQRPPPPQRVVSLQKSLSTPVSATAGSSGSGNSSSLVGMLARKPDVDAKDGIK